MNAKSVVNRGKMEGHSEMFFNPKAQLETATAARLRGATDAEGFPRERDWDIAGPFAFDADWRGQNSDPKRETEVRVLWTPDTLHIRFDAKYRSITVFADAEPDGRRDHLWDRDVCELFLAPDVSNLTSYKEIEVAPNGFWIDLSITPEEKHDLQSKLRRRVRIDEKAETWQALLAVPMKSLIGSFDPRQVWRANFYRIEGAAEPRFYSAWRPTGTAKPNFHVPEAFGKLIFA